MYITSPSKIFRTEMFLRWVVSPKLDDQHLSAAHDWLCIIFWCVFLVASQKVSTSWSEWASSHVASDNSEVLVAGQHQKWLRM